MKPALKERCQAETSSAFTATDTTPKRTPNTTSLLLSAEGKERRRSAALKRSSLPSTPSRRLLIPQLRSGNADIGAAPRGTCAGGRGARKRLPSHSFCLEKQRTGSGFVISLPVLSPYGFFTLGYPDRIIFSPCSSKARSSRAVRSPLRAFAEGLCCPRAEGGRRCQDAPRRCAPVSRALQGRAGR